MGVANSQRGLGVNKSSGNLKKRWIALLKIRELNVFGGINHRGRID